MISLIPRWRFVIGGACFALSLYAVTNVACADEPITETVPDPDWDRVFDRAEGWIGGDAIYSVPLPGGDVLWLFADTYLGRVVDHHRQPGTKMVNNTLARHGVPAPGMVPNRGDVRFLWGSPPAALKPKAWIAPDPAVMPAGNEELWYWVADGIVAPGGPHGERLILFLWRIARTSRDTFGFRSAGGALAIVDNPADDWTTWRPRQFNVAHSVPAPREKDEPHAEVAWGSEVLQHQDEDGRPWLLVYGYRQWPKGVTQLVMARTPADSVEDMNQWQFRTGDGWLRALDEAVTLAEGITTEFSVTRVEDAANARWVLVHSEPWFGTQILARSSSSPFGPWSAARPVYQVPGIDRAKKHFTYAAKAHPELSRPGELLMSYVVNSFDFGESAGNAKIYRPRFARVPQRLLPDIPAQAD